MKFVTREDSAIYEGFFAGLNEQMIRAQQRIQPEMNASAIKVTGGWATHDGLGAYNTQIVGWGSTENVSDTEIEDVLALYENRKGNVRIEVSMLADQTLISRLEEKGFRVRGWVVTTGRKLTEQDVNSDNKSPFTFRLAKESEETIWSETMNRGFTNNEDEEIDEDLLTLSRTTFNSDPIIPFLALEGDKPAGAGALTVKGDLAYLVGAATLPSFRRRGVQTGMQKIRIAHAAKMGAKKLLFNGLPGTESLHNAIRQGMTPLYASVVLAHQPIDNLAF